MLNSAAMTPHRTILAVLPLVLWSISAIPCPAQAAKAQAKPPFAIPPRQGQLTDFYPGPTASARQYVVIIQDLHANVGVQKNISSILFRLLNQNKVPWLLVCVEGASGEGERNSSSVSSSKNISLRNRARLPMEGKFFSVHLKPKTSS